MAIHFRLDMPQATPMSHTLSIPACQSFNAVNEEYNTVILLSRLKAQLRPTSDRFVSWCCSENGKPGSHEDYRRRFSSRTPSGSFPTPTDTSSAHPAPILLRPRHCRLLPIFLTASVSLFYPLRYTHRWKCSCIIPILLAKWSLFWCMLNPPPHTYFFHFLQSLLENETGGARGNQVNIKCVIWVRIVRKKMERMSCLNSLPHSSLRTLFLSIWRNNKPVMFVNRHRDESASEETFLVRFSALRCWMCVFGISKHLMVMTLTALYCR